MNCAECLRLRERGLLADINFNIEIMKAKVKGMQIYRPDVSERYNKLEKCQYAIKFGNRIAGAWTYKQNKTIIQTRVIDYHLEGTREGNIITTLVTGNRMCDKFRNCQVTDMCPLITANEGHLLFYIANNAYFDENLTHLTRGSQGDITEIKSRNFYLAGRLWSCACSPVKKTGIVGATNGDESCVYLVKFNDDLWWPFPVAEGNPFSLDFSDDGNSFYSGLHNGKLVSKDLRTSDPIYTTHVCLGRAIRNLKLISNQYNIIVSGDDGLLKKIDQRMNDVVFEYPEHQSVSKKLPFTYDESLDLLVSPGEDNIVRTWSLRHGKILDSFRPKTQNFAGQVYSVLMPKGRKMFLHSILNERIFTDNL